MEFRTLYESVPYHFKKFQAICDLKEDSLEGHIAQGYEMVLNDPDVIRRKVFRIGLSLNQDTAYPFHSTFKPTLEPLNIANKFAGFVNSAGVNRADGIIQLVYTVLFPTNKRRL